MTAEATRNLAEFWRYTNLLREKNLPVTLSDQDTVRRRAARLRDLKWHPHAAMRIAIDEWRGQHLPAEHHSYRGPVRNRTR
jgi:hypothetical protein